jgi:hypothetical protein
MTTSHDGSAASGPADLTTDLPDRRAPLVRHAELPVNEHAIRVWCAAVGETNPIYHDDAAARQAAYSGVVARGAMLQTWTMPVSLAARQAAPTLHAQIRERACEAGYRSVVATDYEQEYLRPIHPGALLTELTWWTPFRLRSRPHWDPGGS